MSGTWVEDPPGSGLYVFSATAETTQGYRLARGYLDATIEGRTVIWVQRDNTIVDGYIVWARPKPMGSRQIQIRAASLWSYFRGRILTVTKTYDDVDQLEIAQDLINWAQTGPGDINVEVETETSGVLRERLPLAFGYERKNIGTLVEQLAAVIDGFDFAITCALENEVPTARFRCFYPRRGSRSSGVVFNGGVFALKQNLLDYSVDPDGTDGATTVYGIGAGEGTDMLLTQSVNTAALDQGYPVKERTVTHKDVDQIETLQGHTDADLRGRAQTPTTWVLDVDPDDVSIPFGSWQVGDDVRVIIGDDERFPAGENGENGFDGTLRIVAQTTVVNDDGGPDRVLLQMGAARG